MAIQPLQIIGSYNKDRFIQYNPEDVANWNLIPSPTGKKEFSMFPTLGRKHITLNNINQLIFDNEPRGLFKSVNFWYVVDGSLIYRIDSNFNRIEITGGQVLTETTPIFFTFLVAGTITFSVFVDGQRIYVYREDTNQFFTVTDANAPTNPLYVASFGNRITVSSTDSSEFRLSRINLDGSAFNPANCFTIPTIGAVFAQEAGIIRQMAVLHNQLYIFTDYTTGIWANIPSEILTVSTPVTFPWKKNTTYDWDFGMAAPLSLSVDFGMMTWLARSKNGLLQIMATDGSRPTDITSRGINVILQNVSNSTIIPPFIEQFSIGFMYQYENVIFYRISFGSSTFVNNTEMDEISECVEYNFDTKSCQRVIELDGDRCLVKRHVFFNNTHFVSVEDENTVYEMSGKFYTNDIRNPLQPDPQEEDAYEAQPFRYERITPLIYQEDYAEFITDYVEIDFVWGDGTATTDVVNEPFVELYYSDDGGISFNPADNRQFSNLGVYRWRMRWYELSTSRNRCYKLISVSKFPMVVLGGVMNVRRSSGGAN